MAVNPYDMSPDPNDPSKDPTRVGYMGQLDLKSPINPQEAFNAQKAGRMPSIQQNQNPLLSAATTAKNVYDFGKAGNAMYSKASELLGANAPTPAGGLAGAYPAAPAGTPVPLARPEGLGLASSSSTSAIAPSAGQAALAANASPTGLAAAKAAEGSITAGAQTASPALGELIGAGTAGEASAAAGATELAALGEGAAGLGADLAGAGLVAGAGEGLASIAEFLPMLLNRGGRIGKAGGGLTAKKQIINTEDPKFHAMKVAFDNLVRKYDNPLLAAVAMHSGTQVVDSAIRQAAHTGKEISDFLPKSAVLYMYLLSKAAIGAHSKLKDRTARKSGGRLGYATRGDVSASDVEGTTDTLSTPEQTGDQNVQLASASTDYRDYLIGKGYSPAAASGIIGNAYHESGGLNSTIKGDSGNSFGLFQFNQQGEQPAFRKWVADNKRDATDPYAQLDFVDQRLRNNYSDTFDKLQNAKDPSEAAKHFMLGYERPKEGPTQQLNARMQYANKIAAGEDLPTNTKDYGDQAPATGGGLNAKKGPFEKIADTVGIPDVVPKESSFWVPLIAGLGGMLASNQYRFSQRLGEGLLAGAGAYGSQQDREFKQQQLAQQKDLQESQIMKNTLGLAAERFKPIGGGKFYDAVRGEAIDADEYRNRLNQIPGFSKYAGSMGMAGAGNKSAGETNQPTGQATGQPEAKPAAQPSANKPVSTELPKNISDVQDIYKHIDSIPEVANAKRAYESLSLQAQDPALIASGQSAAIRAQAAQALNVYNDVRNKYATVAVEEAKKKMETSYSPQFTETGAKIINPQGPAITQEPPAQSSEPQEVKKATLDPKTATVTSSIPAAPANGGLPPINVPKGSIVTELPEAHKEQQKNDSAFYKDFLEKQPDVDRAMALADQMTNAFKLIKSGATTNMLAGYAALADSYGDHDLSKRILGGDLGAAQLIQKDKVNLVLQQLKAAQPRFAQSEFNKLSDVGTPDIDLSPKANHAMLASLKGGSMWTKQFMNDWQVAQQQGWKSPSAFYNEWSKANPISTYEEAARKQIGTFGGMDLPKHEEWTAGATYVVPKNLSREQMGALSKRGLTSGDIFRYDGKDIQKVSPSDMFKFGVQ